MIDLADEHLAEVRRILQAHVPKCEVLAFGSRVRGNAQTYSDLDLALAAPEKIPQRQLEDLKDSFAESDLPFRVDVLDWHEISDRFRKTIEEKCPVIILRN